MWLPASGAGRRIDFASSRRLRNIDIRPDGPSSKPGNQHTDPDPFRHKFPFAPLRNLHESSGIGAAGQVPDEEFRNSSGTATQAVIDRRYSKGGPLTWHS